MHKKLFPLRRLLLSQNFHTLHRSPPVPFPWEHESNPMPLLWWESIEVDLGPCVPIWSLVLIWSLVPIWLYTYVWFTDEVSFALACKAYTGTLIRLCTNWSLRGCIWPCWCGVDLALVFLHHYIYSLLCACRFSFIHRAAAESAVWGLGSKQSQFNWDEVLESGLKMSVLTQQTPIIEQMLST